MCKGLVQGGLNPHTGSFFPSIAAEIRAATPRTSFDTKKERTALSTISDEANKAELARVAGEFVARE